MANLITPTSDHVFARLGEQNQKEAIFPWKKKNALSQKENVLIMLNDLEVSNSSFHFAFLEPELQIRAVSGVRLENYHDSYYDTKNFEFMKKNVWIRRRRNINSHTDQWLIRKVTRTLLANGFQNFKFQELQFDSEEKVRQCVGISIEEVVAFSFARYTLSDTPINAVVDVTQINENEFYCVGEWNCYDVKSQEALSLARDLRCFDQSILVPVHSKVIQHIYKNLPQLYTELKLASVVAETGVQIAGVNIFERAPILHDLEIIAAVHACVNEDELVLDPEPENNIPTDWKIWIAENKINND